MAPQWSQYHKRMWGPVILLNRKSVSQWVMRSNSFIIRRFGVRKFCQRLVLPYSGLKHSWFGVRQNCCWAALPLFHIVTITIWCKAICCTVYSQVGWFVLGIFTIVCFYFRKFEVRQDWSIDILVLVRFDGSTFHSNIFGSIQVWSSNIWCLAGAPFSRWWLDKRGGRREQEKVMRTANVVTEKHRF